MGVNGVKGVLNLKKAEIHPHESIFAFGGLGGKLAGLNLAYH